MIRRESPVPTSRASSTAGEGINPLIEVDDLPPLIVSEFDEGSNNRVIRSGGWFRGGLGDARILRRAMGKPSEQRGLE